MNMSMIFGLSAALPLLLAQLQVRLQLGRLARLQVGTRLRERAFLQRTALGNRGKQLVEKGGAARSLAKALVDENDARRVTDDDGVGGYFTGNDGIGGIEDECSNPHLSILSLKI